MSTAVTSVSLPEHLYAMNDITVNDNTIRTYSTNTSGYTKMLCVFTSPEGESDVLRTIDEGYDSFIANYGDGPHSIYGQPFLNAKIAAASGAAILQCLRITAEDATYANKHVYIRYKITEAVTVDTVTTPASMQIAFVTKSTADLTDLSKLASTAPAPDTTTDGWTEMRLFSFASKGKGKYGENYKIRFSNNYRSDRISGYKNYFLTEFKNNTKANELRVCLSPDAIIASNSYFIENIINDPTIGSTNVIVDVNEAVLSTLFTAYKSFIDPNTTLTADTFDPLLGINKNLAIASSTKWTDFEDADTYQIAGLEIIDDETLGTIQLNSVVGFALTNGSDGAFAVGAAGRDAAINARYVKAFKGEIDRNILSKNRCPLDVALDADYDFVTVKPALATLIEKRNEDLIGYFDLNTDLDTLASPYENSVDLDLYTNNWTYEIDGYYGKIKDPFNYRIIKVTSTYNLAANLPSFWKLNGGKHIPYAGVYGKINTYLENSVYPVYDDSVDSAYLDKLVDSHVNYAQINAKGEVIRGSQTTRYPYLGVSSTISNLSEGNNAHIILDIKHDADKIASEFHYKFNEGADINLFNRKMEVLTAKYSAAQVKKIAAKFERTDEEAEIGILHLYISVVHKSIVKIVKVDIDVNRGVDA